jgi:urea transporter
MTIRRLALLLGPAAVRDVVGGSAGIVLCTAAIALGCAFASAATVAWYAFFGLLGVVSLGTSVPKAWALLASAATEIVDPGAIPLRKAA